MKIKIFKALYNNKIPASLIDLILKYPFLVISLLIITLAVSLCSVFSPLVVSQTLDALNTNEFQKVPIKNLLWLVIAFGFLSLIQTALSSFIGEKISFDLRYLLTQRLAHQSVRFVDQQTPARLLTRFVSDADSVKNIISGGVVSLFSALFLLAGILVMLFHLSPSLSWWISGCLPFILGFFAFIIFRLRPLFKKVQELLEKINSQVSESIHAASLIRILNAQGRQKTNFLKINQQSYSYGLKIVNNLVFIIPFVSFSLNLISLIILEIGGEKIIAGSMSLGDFSAFLGYSALLLMPIFLLAGSLGVFTHSFVSFARIKDVLEKPLEQVEGCYKGEVKGHYELEKVSLSYKDTSKEKVVLDSLSLTLPPHASVAILGPVGAGKTQLFNLLTGLISPTSGSLLLEGVSMEDWDKRYLSSQIGVVFQDSVLFSGTLRDNLGKPDLQERAIRKVLKTAQLEEFVKTLPQGLETKLGEGGATLSGGQRQRLMLARALAHEPKLLFLDDFTARLDVKTSTAVQEALKANYPQTTIFIISQTLQVAQQVDQVILLMEGKVIARGTHEELKRTSFDYREILKSQKVIKA